MSLELKGTLVAAPEETRKEEAWPALLNPSIIYDRLKVLSGTD
jgi:hypothetical protein